jgi:hypothetical protein
LAGTPEKQQNRFFGVLVPHAGFEPKAVAAVRNSRLSKTSERQENAGQAVNQSS